MQLNHLDTTQLLELHTLLAHKAQLDKTNKVETVFTSTGPLARLQYTKHLEFFEKGSTHKLRLFMAANRVGKTFSAAYELSLHLTGRYPDWWAGKRFKFSNNWWVCGVDNKLIQSELQQALLGPIGEFGTGMIPKDALDFDSLKDAKKADTPISTFRVMHSSGTYSSVQFKSYESGREAFQSAKVNIWLDEEPPISVFTECLLRTMDTGGEQHILMMTFTPLKGLSETVMNFLEMNTLTEGEIFGPDGSPTGKWVTRCGWDDVPHISAADKRIMLASIPPWARDARSKGIPQMGSGAIYQVPLSEITVPRFEIPAHWQRYAGMDVGSKTAAVWIAVDPSTQTHYIYHEYYQEGALPSVHASNILLPGDWIPIAIDSAAHGRSQIDGENLFDIYASLGLSIHNANKAVEAGLYTVWERLANGRLKLFADLKKLQEEYQLYRRDEKGRVVKTNDHLLDALRYAVMSSDKAVNASQVKKNTLTAPTGVSTQFRPQPIIRRTY